MRNLILLSLLASAVVVAHNAAAQSGPLQYYSLTPCRVVDTRNPNSTNGGPVFGPSTTRNFAIRGFCGVPATAKAVALNVAIVSPSVGGWLTLWPSGQTRPVASTINFSSSDPALSNGAIVGISALAEDLSVYNSEGSVHVLLDVTGYFE